MSSIKATVRIFTTNSSRKPSIKSTKTLESNGSRGPKRKATHWSRTNAAACQSSATRARSRIFALVSFSFFYLYNKGDCLCVSVCACACVCSSEIDAHTVWPPRAEIWHRRTAERSTRKLELAAPHPPDRGGQRVLLEVHAAQSVRFWEDFIKQKLKKTPNTVGVGQFRSGPSPHPSVRRQVQVQGGFCRPGTMAVWAETW